MNPILAVRLSIVLSNTVVTIFLAFDASLLRLAVIGSSLKMRDH